MQLWWPSGQFLFKHGWHDKVFFNTKSFGFFHWAVSSELVGPNIEIVFVWNADAICIGPESPVIKRSILEIMFIRSDIDVFPVRSLYF